MEKWDSLPGFVLLPGLCSRGRIKPSFVPSFSFWQELYLFRRLVHLKKKKFHHDLYFLLCTSTNIIPSFNAKCILLDIQIRVIGRAVVLLIVFWVELISYFLPLILCPSPTGWNLTCDRVSHQPAKSAWSSSSCPAEIQERSGTRSRSWFCPPWCRSHTR